MNYKQIVHDIRMARKLRGKYPCVISIPVNEGKIVTEKKEKRYVLTITDDNLLYFHALTKWTKAYDEDNDFMVKIDAIKQYTMHEPNKYTYMVTLATEKGLFLPLNSIHGLKNTYESTNNFNYILKELEKRGVKKDYINYGTTKEETDGKRTNKKI